MAKITIQIEAEEAKILHRMLYWIGEDEAYPEAEYNIVAMDVSDRILKSFRKLSREDFNKVFKKERAGRAEKG